jgi:hypothetical protein
MRAFVVRNHFIIIRGDGSVLEHLVDVSHQILFVLVSFLRDYGNKRTTHSLVATWVIADVFGLIDWRVTLLCYGGLVLAIGIVPRLPFHKHETFGRRLDLDRLLEELSVPFQYQSNLVRPVLAKLSTAKHAQKLNNFISFPLIFINGIAKKVVPLNFSSSCEE